MLLSVPILLALQIVRQFRSHPRLRRYASKCDRPRVPRICTLIHACCHLAGGRRPPNWARMSDGLFNCVWMCSITGHPVAKLTSRPMCSWNHIPSVLSWNRRRDMTPQQDSLSGVIVCPAYWMGQQLRVNSFTTACKCRFARKQSQEHEHVTAGRSHFKTFSIGGRGSRRPSLRV